MKLSRNTFFPLLIALLVIPLAASAQVKVPAGTEVKVAFKQDVSSKDLKPGAEVPIALTEALSVGGVVLVKATVKSVTPAGKPGKGGKISLELVGIDPDGSYKSMNDQKLTLQTDKGTLEAKGKGKWWAWFPLFIPFVKGGEAVFPADQPFTAKVKEDIFIIPAG
jgi:hypothetical protein